MRTSPGERRGTSSLPVDGELRARTNPRKADSDRDGIGDAEEDSDGDRLDNGSELDSRTDPRRRDTDRDGTRDGAEDPDKDRLINTAEDRTGHHPRKADSDGDGIHDGDENAGAVEAFDGATLTIALAVGGTLTASVDDGTAVACDDDPYYDDEPGGGASDDEELDEDWGDDDVDVASVRARLAEEGDEDDADDEDWGDDELGDCTAELVPGTAVHEAAVEEGVFVALELLS